MLQLRRFGASVDREVLMPQEYFGGYRDLYLGRGLFPRARDFRCRILKPFHPTRSCRC